MIAVLEVTELIELANRSGFSLALTEDPGARLYAWVTPDNEVVYIGKADREVPALRSSDEQRWMELDPHGAWILSGIVHLLRRNDAVLRRIAIEPRDGRADGFDSAPVEEVIKTWDGPAGGALRARMDAGEWTVDDIETVLIRIGIRCGVPIGNSRCASQWESWIGDPRDTLAVVATDSLWCSCERHPRPGP